MRSTKRTEKIHLGAMRLRESELAFDALVARAQSDPEAEEAEWLLVEALEAAGELEPGTGSAGRLIRLGQALRDRRREPEAIRAAELARDLASEGSKEEREGWLLAAELHLIGERPAEAIDAAEIVLAHDDRSARAHLFRARALGQQGRSRAALQDLGEALGRANPGDEPDLGRAVMELAGELRPRLGSKKPSSARLWPVLSAILALAVVVTFAWSWSRSGGHGDGGEGAAPDEPRASVLPRASDPAPPLATEVDGDLGNEAGGADAGLVDAGLAEPSLGESAPGDARPDRPVSSGRSPAGGPPRPAVQPAPGPSRPRAPRPTRPRHPKRSLRPWLD